MVDCFDLCQCRQCGTYYYPEDGGEKCRRCREHTPKWDDKPERGQIIDVEV